MSRTIYAIKYVGCPVLWCSRLQTQTVLSTIETEYVAVSQSMRNAIHFMELMEEVKFIFVIHLLNPEDFCKVIEDNSRCIAVAELYIFPDN